MNVARRLIILFWSAISVLKSSGYTKRVLYPRVKQCCYTGDQVRQKRSFFAETSSPSSSAAAVVSIGSTSTSEQIPSLPATPPLAPHTFAGRVEARLRERFTTNTNDGSIDRIIQSWRLLEQGYEHNEYFGSTERHHDGDESMDSNNKNNKLKRQFLQHCHSYVPGLTVKDFWEPSDFAWCQKLESKYQQILAEFQAVTADPASLHKIGNNIWASALTDDASSYGEGWKTLVLMNRGWWDPVNVNLFPVTSKAVRDCGVPAVEVFFASMQPNSVIQPHSDFTNFVLTSHLPLIVPYSGQNKCRLGVGETTTEWINGKLLLFDTSIIHDAINESDQTRYILMLRLWHPDLTEKERAALQFTFDCLELPDLISDDIDERKRAESTVEKMRSFPEIKKGSSKVQGFGGGKMHKNRSEKKKRKNG